MRRDVTMQTICQVIMEKREGDGEMMQGTKEGKNGRKKKNRKMNINKQEGESLRTKAREQLDSVGNECMKGRSRLCLSLLRLLQNLLRKVTLGVYIKGVAQIKFWLGSVLYELLMKVRLL